MNMSIHMTPVRWVRRLAARPGPDALERCLRRAVAPHLTRDHGAQHDVPTEEDRAVLDRCLAVLPQLAQERASLTRLHSQGLDVIGQLSRYAMADHTLTEDARRRLRELTLHAHRMAEAHAAPPHAEQLAGVDEDVGSGALQARDADRYARSVLLGLACSVGVVGLLLAQHYAVAALLFTARVAVDALLALTTGGPTDLVPMPDDRRSLSLRTRFVGDAISHFGEVAVWIALTFVLAHHGQEDQALFAAVAIALTLFAAMVRNGASEAGLPALRRARYRLARRLGVGAGLWLVALGPVMPGVVLALGVAAVSGTLHTTFVLRQVWRLQTTDVGVVVRGADPDGTLQTSFVHGPPPRSRR